MWFQIIVVNNINMVTIQLTSLDFAVGDLHIFTAGDVDSVGVGTSSGRCDGQSCQLYTAAILDRHVNLLAIHDFETLYPQIRAVVE